MDLIQLPPYFSDERVSMITRLSSKVNIQWVNEHRWGEDKNEEIPALIPTWILKSFFLQLLSCRMPA
jgi:hypothetical protein